MATSRFFSSILAKSDPNRLPASNTLYRLCAPVNVDGNGTDGSDPSSVLVQAGDGDICGTTGAGGANGFGTLFEITTVGKFKFKSFTTFAPNPAARTADTVAPNSHPSRLGIAECICCDLKLRNQDYRACRRDLRQGSGDYACRNSDPQPELPGAVIRLPGRRP